MPASTQNTPLVFRWLPWLIVLWIAATWYGETRLERLVVSGDNLAPEGDFSDGLPGGPHWEYAGISADLWQPTGGIEEGAALRIGGDGPGGLLRYRFPMAYRADGYFAGICLRGDTPAGQQAVEARLIVRRADMPLIRLPDTALAKAIDARHWHCGLKAVSIPPGLDELVVEVVVPAGSPRIGVDRFVLQPAVSPPPYSIWRGVLLSGWLVLGGLSLAGILMALGGAGGALLIIAGLLTAGTAVFGLGEDVAGAAQGALRRIGEAIDAFYNPVFEALRIFTGDRGWRPVGETDALALAAMLGVGFLAAWLVAFRYRWRDPPWRSAFLYAVLFGLAVQALRLLIHAASFATVHWVMDPFCAAGGMAAGFLTGSVLLRKRVHPGGD